MLLVSVLPAMALSDSFSGSAVQPETPEASEARAFMALKTTPHVVLQSLDYNAASLQPWNWNVEELPNEMEADKFGALRDTAMRYLGVRYAPGGKNPAEGFDCSGFAAWVFNRSGHIMKAYSCAEQYNSCYPINPEYAMPGDMVFFTGTQRSFGETRISHVGIYLGDGKMIHAGMKGIAIVNVFGEYYADHFFGFGRFLY